MATDLIPVIDLRFLSQSDLNTLSLSSPNTFNLSHPNNIINPKIDRSIFNESAGSRKQTYSRLPLAPPTTSSSPSPPSILPRRRGRPRSTPSSAPTPAPPPSDDPDRRENLLIASFLRTLFSRDDEDRSNSGWTNILAAAEEAQKALVLAEDRDKEILDSKGVAVDLVKLGRMEDPFGDELRRQTEGMKTDEELLGFLSGVEGQWGSRRKRRRFVDASLFGDVLPRSWKLLLGLKRKEGASWLECRRYVRFAGLLPLY